MSKIIRWGILGAGSIAKKFASDLQHVQNAKLVAIGSRTQENANAFADLFSIEKRYSSYLQLVEDKDIDIIYIATPHILHHENTLMCLQHHKAVLCEKPFAINQKQVLGMIQLAKEKKIFLMEALWSRFLPHFIKLKEMLAQGMIGEVTALQANFGFKTSADSNKRLTEIELGGGTLLDIGIYNIFFALHILGNPDNLEVAMVPNASGADEQCAITFHYHNGAVAQLFSSFKADIPIDLQIFGTKGNIKLTQRFYEPTCTIQFSTDGGKNYELIEVEKAKGIGYEYEAQHATDCLLAGKMESDLMTFEESLVLIKLLDQVRAKGGLAYPQD
jgi:predicted dehydrogenase